ncbi:hypothetical protein BH23GEM6_BH23GEM6_00340 [soil metagenome]
MESLNVAFYGTAIRDWILALLVAVCVFSALELVRSLLVLHLGRLAQLTVTFVDNAAVAALRASRTC